MGGRGKNPRGQEGPEPALPLWDTRTGEQADRRTEVGRAGGDERDRQEAHVQEEGNRGIRAEMIF